MRRATLVIATLMLAVPGADATRRPDAAPQVSPRLADALSVNVATRSEPRRLTVEPLEALPTLGIRDEEPLCARFGVRPAGPPEVLIARQDASGLMPDVTVFRFHGTSDEWTQENVNRCMRVPMEPKLG
jgi:hypothetical protein